MKIGICIVHYGAQELLDNCLKSFQVSKDSSGYNYTDFDYLPEVDRIPTSTFVIRSINNNKNNIGFTEANNKLIKSFMNCEYCLEDGSEEHWNYDWIWLLNNDTTVPSETLKAIEEKLNKPCTPFDASKKSGLMMDSSVHYFIPSDVGIIGFQIRSMDEPDFIHHAGTGQCFPNGIHKTGSVKLKQCQKRTPEKWVTFASVLIRREVFEKIGLLDENMKFICSDSDFCYRARAAGFKIIYEPSFVIYHKIGQASQSNSSVEMQKHSDTVYFQGKWMNGKLFFDLDKELL